MTKRLRVSAIAAKLESVSGTDSVPTLASNAVRFVGVPQFSPDYVKNGLRDDVQFGAMAHLRVPLQCHAEPTVEIDDQEPLLPEGRAW